MTVNLIQLKDKKSYTRSVIILTVNRKTEALQQIRCSEKEKNV